MEDLERRSEELFGRGKYIEAISLKEQMCSLLEEERGQMSIELAGCVSELAKLYRYQGAYEKAEPLYERALAVREKVLGSEHPDVGRSLNSLAVLRADQGAYGEAELLYARALVVLEKALGSEHAEVATSLNNLAMMYDVQGMYGKAEPLLKRALVIWKKTLGPDHSHVALGLNNLANLYHHQGAYGEAERLHNRVLAIWKRTLGPDHPHVATSLNNLADLCHDQGEYRRAEMLHKRALDIRMKTLGSDHLEVALSLHNLASLYKDQGKYEEAEPLYEQALAIFKMVLGPDHPHVAQGINNLASLYKDQGKYEKAEPRYEQALAIFEKALGPSHPFVAQSLNNLARLHQDQGEHERAELLYKQALAIFQNTLDSSHPKIGWTLANLASLNDDRGDYDLALDLRLQALQIEETNLARTLTIADEAHRLAYASTLSGTMHYALSLHLGVTPGHDAIARLALTTLLRRKNRVQDLVTQSTATLRRSLPGKHRHLLDELVDVDSRIAVLSNRGPGKLGIEAFRQQLDEIERQRDQLWNELAKHSALIEAVNHPVTIEDIQRTLPAGGALVELIQYVPQHDDAGARLRVHESRPPSRYSAYLVFPDRFDWVDLGAAAPINKHVKAFRKALQTKQAIPIDLYDTVLRPIVEKLGPTDRYLLIAPAGDLSLVPFGALYDGKRYLVEQYDLRYVTTGRELLDRPASLSVTTTPVTIVANPAGAHLSDAEAEAVFLRDFFPGARVLLGKQATETNIRTVERPFILHMATHGFFGKARNERDNPMFRSGLFMADIEKVEVNREYDDGQLTAYEVSGMDLRGTQLVVLSACETGLGAATKAEGLVLMSEGVSGLRRAFAMAGARTTVMSLWEVSGVTAQKTMEAYYRKLAEGMGRGEAMQAVQLEMLRSKDRVHPKDWAAFIVSGDDGPMKFPVGQGPRVEEPHPVGQPGPPPVRHPRGCAVGALSSEGGRGLPGLLMGLMGLGAARRRR